MPLMTKTEYAKHRGCSKAYLSKKDVKARLAPAMDGGKIDSDKADAIFRVSRDTAKVRKPETAFPPGPPAEDADQDDVLTMDVSRRENLRLKNEALQLQLLEKKGQTVSRDAVVSAAAAAGQIVREGLAMRNMELAEKLATMNDTRAILVMIEASDREILGRMSDEFIQRATGDSGGREAATAH